ncbi:hypothetical protein N5C66_22580 [Rhizobium pusense]|nr:hypothetical protein [Agrobacterium pusense]MDH0910476.1 hypothetical protein [Agrobacterium pusense]MDH1098409.1 hypothetical protein [Agrobacterium pusense]MDH1114519.1 hypothetical protein [Agrobacterium pusense]MDH2195717.1 hypothetical protein [Agrobacterium pusense]
MDIEEPIGELNTEEIAKRLAALAEEAKKLCDRPAAPAKRREQPETN